jgi:hypothetical protein
VFTDFECSYPTLSFCVVPPTCTGEYGFAVARKANCITAVGVFASGASRNVSDGDLMHVLQSAVKIKLTIRNDAGTLMMRQVLLSDCENIQILG